VSRDARGRSQAGPYLLTLTERAARFRPIWVTIPVQKSADSLGLTFCQKGLRVGSDLHPLVRAIQAAQKLKSSIQTR
jgi:hypothetical protein